MASDPSSQINFGLPAWLLPAAMRALGLSQLEQRYAQVREQTLAIDHVGIFCEHALSALNVEMRWPVAELEALRAVQGPIMFVANHPLGGIDALILMALMGRVRSNFSFIGNAMLDVIPELRPALIPVHIVEAKRNLSERRSANAMPLRRAVRALREGQALGIFPAGEVAELPNFRSREVVERAWNPLVGTLLKSTGANVVPIFFDGQNSALFRYGGLAFPKARIALLAREMLRANLRPRFVVGDVVRWRGELEGKPASQIADVLRSKTLALQNHHKE